MFRRRLPLAALLALALTVAQPLTGCAQWSLDVGKAMDAIGVAPGMVVGEAGAGDGYFTFPLLDRVGTKGAVYANDINRRALARLSARADRERYSNVHTVVGEVDDPLFPRKDLDMVVVVHALHDFSQPVEWMVNLKKYLRPGGTLAIVDIDPDRSHASHFWSRERILGYAKEAGYEMVKAADDGGEHLFIVLRPRG
jgi:ubiquinone/menaquinone biosynthesis C-methylase UbiE